MWIFAFKRILKIFNKTQHNFTFKPSQSFCTLNMVIFKTFSLPNFSGFLFLCGLSSQTSMKFCSTPPLSSSSEMLNMRKLWPLTSMRNHGGKQIRVFQPHKFNQWTGFNPWRKALDLRLYVLEAVTELQGRKYQRDREGMVIKATLAL